MHFIQLSLRSPAFLWPRCRLLWKQVAAQPSAAGTICRSLIPPHMTHTFFARSSIGEHFIKFLTKSFGYSFELRTRYIFKILRQFPAPHRGGQEGVLSPMDKGNMTNGIWTLYGFRSVPGLRQC